MWPRTTWGIFLRRRAEDSKYEGRSVTSSRRRLQGGRLVVFWGWMEALSSSGSGLPGPGCGQQAPAASLPFRYMKNSCHVSLYLFGAFPQPSPLSPLIESSFDHVPLPPLQSTPIADGRSLVDTRSLLLTYSRHSATGASCARAFSVQNQRVKIKMGKLIRLELFSEMVAQQFSSSKLIAL